MVYGIGPFQMRRFIIIDSNGTPALIYMPSISVLGLRMFTRSSDAYKYVKKHKLKNAKVFELKHAEDPYVKPKG